MTLFSGSVAAAAAAAEDCGTFLQCAGAGIGDGITGAIGAPTEAVEAVSGAVGAATDFADFWSDPMGNTFLALQDGARNLSEGLLPALTGAVMPDLTATWFLQAYRISFALSIFVFVIILIPQIVRTARGQQSGRELAESLGLYAPAFLIGAMFGPALGAFLVKFFSALSDDLIAWGIQGSTDTLVETFKGMLSEENALGLAGGAVVGSLLMLLMIAGLIIVLLVLIVQLITLYFSGVLFPLGFVWIVDPRKRAFGSKIAYLWLGILASHPLLFFLLGISYSMIAASTSVFADTPTLEKTVMLVVSILALLIAGLSPMLLAKFAPVLPMGGGGSAAPGGTIGPQSMQEADSKMGDKSPSTPSSSPAASDEPSSNSAAAANSTAGGKSTSSSSSSGGDSGGADTGGGASGGDSGDSGSSISKATAGRTNGGGGGGGVGEKVGAAAPSASSIGGGGSGGGSTDGGDASGGTATMGASTPGQASPGHAVPGTPSPGAATPGAAIQGPATPGAALPGASTGGAATGGATAAEGATAGTAAAGAAETATGVGAVVGVPTMIAAGVKAAAGAAEKVYHEAEGVAEKTADIAGSSVDDHEEHYGKDSTHE